MAVDTRNRRANVICVGSGSYRFLGPVPNGNIDNPQDRAHMVFVYEGVIGEVGGGGGGGVELQKLLLGVG